MGNNIVMESNSPNVPAAWDKDSFGYYIQTLDLVVRPKFFEAIEVFAAQGGPSNLDALIQAGANLAGHYLNVVKETIATDEVDHTTKVQIIENLHVTESNLRMEVINQNAGTKLIEREPLEPESPDQKTYHIDDDEWFDEICQDFLKYLNEDLSSLGDYVNEQNPPDATQKWEVLSGDVLTLMGHLKEFYPSAQDKVKEVATIAGSVALGLILAKKFGSRF